MLCRIHELPLYSQVSEHIPLDKLRDRLEELPEDKELVVVCQAGLRGYIGCRILMQNGFTCRNLSGGYRTYVAHQ